MLILNKLDDCLRAYQSAKSTKYINEAEKVNDKVQNQEERGSGNNQQTAEVGHPTSADSKNRNRKPEEEQSKENNLGK